MLVPLRFSGPELRGGNRHRQRERGRVLGVKLQGAVDVLEVTAHPRHHHVPHAKLGGRVSRLKYPGGHLPVPPRSPPPASPGLASRPAPGRRSRTWAPRCCRPPRRLAAPPASGPPGTCGSAATLRTPSHGATVALSGEPGCTG